VADDAGNLGAVLKRAVCLTEVGDPQRDGAGDLDADPRGTR
jgi:hypothetical protein